MSLSSNLTFSQFTVGENPVNMYSIVYLTNDGTIQIADSSILSHENRIVGISLQDGNSGEQILVKKTGNIRNNSWNLATGSAYYLENNGNITDAIPLNGFIQKIGIAKSSTELILQIIDISIPDKNYIHNQIVASANWSISHNLNKFPSVTVVDSGGNKVQGDVIYIDNNNLTISFSAPFSGKVYLN